MTYLAANNAITMPKQLTVLSHKKCPVHVVHPGGSFIFIDLGTPNTLPNDFSGPRIALRRLSKREGAGWRIILHADAGDPFYIVDVTDAAAITTIKNPSNA